VQPVKASLKKFYGRHHELVSGYRVSVTQIRTDLHLLLMSFPSSDGTSTGLDHGQRSGFPTIVCIFLLQVAEKLQQKDS
jgi:hypothetical protein